MGDLINYEIIFKFESLCLKILFYYFKCFWQFYLLKMSCTVLFVRTLLVKSLMIELTLLTLLNYVGDNFCEYRNLGHDSYKSLLLSYSDASNKFGPLEVKKVIEKSENFKVTAVAIAAIKCPQHIVK